MFSKNSYQFLIELKKNNNREWFAKNKSWYEESRTDFEILVSQLISKIALFDNKVHNTDPKKSIFRIYRDTRFSPDKTPYKTHFGAVLTPPLLGKSSGYYLHIDPDGSFISCGHYMLSPDQLKKVRREIYNDFETFQSIIQEEQLQKVVGDLYRDEDVLKRIPHEFDKDHPAAEYMKLKHFYVMKEFSEKELFKDDFLDYITSIYKLMYPLNEFLNELILE